MDDIAWLDEARKEDETREKDEYKDFLDVTTLVDESSSIAVDNESREKRDKW